MGGKKEKIDSIILLYTKSVIADLGEDSRLVRFPYGVPWSRNENGH